MASTPKRPLVKGPLQPPQPQLNSKSYTQKPASKEEVFTTSGKEKSISVVEFNSRAVEQPFLDPSIMQKRIEAEKQWKAEQEKSSKAEGNSQGR
ncbi:uncharacterized protein PAC_05283 [Phialocephala subalpina]|uniref:Uncharacterized protein n=1 Tax=Phialocephala subalpina TaxID=576137 RepID=A0A1L7WRJ6_9HELO|nr:uncharacterized protein PAC_05283 [Phialocephala subalpina]